MFKRETLCFGAFVAFCTVGDSAFAACNNTGNHYHATGGSTCTYDASTDFTIPYSFNGNNYTAYFSGSAQRALMYVSGAGSTMNVLVDAYIEQSGGARHAIQVTDGAFLNATGNLVAVSYNSTNSRALHTSGTVTVGGNLETYRYGSGGSAGLEVTSTGVLNVTGNGYLYSAASGITGFRSFGTSHFGGNLTIEHNGQSPTVAAGPYALHHSGTLQIDGALNIETEDAVGVNHASNSITAQSLYLETKTRGNGTLTSTTSADAYQMAAGTGNFTGASTIISRGRGVVFTGAQGTLNLGLGSSGLAPEAGVAKLGVGPLASIQAEQAAIVFGDAAATSYTLIDAGASVSGAAGLFLDGTGDSHLEINAGANLSGDIVFGDGSDQLTLNGQVDLTNIAVINGGDDMGSADGMIDNLNFRGGYSGIPNGKFVNWENVNFYDGTYTVAGGVLSAGYDADTGVFIHSGAILDAGNAFTVAANLTTLDTGTFDIRGGGSGDYVVNGMLTNGGIVASDDGATGDKLTVQGDFIGNGGIYQIDTVLYDDNSPTDRMIVQGNTSGSSFVKVMNAGGTGAQTVEGIKIIEVGGASDGTFSLVGDYVHEGEQAVVGGAYAYKLYKGSVSEPDDGDWYLRSQLKPTDPVDPVDPVEPDSPLYQAGVPTYESYPQALLGLNGVSTLQQRVGNRFWLGNGNRVIAQGADAIQPYAAPEEAGTYAEGNGVWGRIEGAHNKIEPRNSLSESDYRQNIFKLQAGLDGQLGEYADGSLIGGIFVQYVHGKTKIRSRHGDGEISTDGYGLGGTLTWYGNEGFYVDAQAQATWYNSDLSSTLAGMGLTSGNNGFGYALSIESGKRFAIDPAWSVTPQAQFVYSSIDFDDFTDAFGAPVGLERGDSLQGRFGIALDYGNSWKNAKGMQDRAHIYGIANLYHEFLDGTRVDVAGTKFSSENDPWWGGLGIGGSYNWDDDKYSIYGEGVVKTSLNNFGDSYSLKGTLGLRIRW